MPPSDWTSPHECVGCGFCCRKAACVVASSVYRVQAYQECPGLFWDGEKWRCKLAVAQKEALHIGAGCCCSLNTYRKNIPTPEDLVREGS